MVKSIHTIIATVIMLGIVYIIFASMSGTPESSRDYYDGSSRSVYP